MQPDRETDRQPDRLTDRQTDREPQGAARPGHRPKPEPEPGEAVPPAARRRLERPPSDRFAVPELEPDRTGSMARTIAGAALPSLAGAAVLIVLASPLALSEPLVLIGLLTGLVAGRGARWGGGEAVPTQRRRAIATAAAVLSIAAAQVAIWQLAIAQGGVLALGDYLVQVFGPVAPLEVLVGGVAAWASA